jgi:hypothetical protein
MSHDAVACRPALSHVPNKDVRGEWSSETINVSKPLMRRCLGRATAHVSGSRYALFLPTLLEGAFSQRMARPPPTGEYVFDFAVVVFGVRLPLPRGFRAQANIPSTSIAFSSGLAPLSADARRDIYSFSSAVTSLSHHVNVRSSYSVHTRRYTRH